ncbi:MAG: DUF116 domain-containing protein [Desulfobacteraceae bacterium]
MKQETGPEKRRFIFLLLLTCLVLVALAAVLWWVPYVGFASIHPHLPLIMAIVFGGAVLFLLGGGLTLVFTILRGRNLFFNRRIRGVVIRFLFPLLVIVGKLVGIAKPQVRRSFVAINNQLVLAEARKVPPEKMLILLPHCLQYHECTVRITAGVEHCKKCGRCKIKDLVTLGETYGVSLAVATGGTLARKIVVEKKPALIIAVACERDLTSGIQDTYPIPVFGVLNRRPNGPCYDTDVDLDKVEEGVRHFLEQKSDAAQRSGPVPVEQEGREERALG